MTDADTVLAGLFALTGAISAVEAAYKFIAGKRPEPHAILGRAVVFVACVAAITVLLVVPAMKKAHAIASHPPLETAEQHYQRGQQLYSEHNRPAAIKEAKEAIVLEPTNAQAHKLLATCYGVDGNMDGAANEFKQAADINPDDMEAELGLAVALDAEGERQPASRAYRHVINNPGSNPEQVQQARTRLQVIASRGQGS